jgi:hypothetical protein
MEHETFWVLLKDPAHWQFEIFLMIIFDGLVGVLIWPKIKQWFTHHKEDDTKLHQLEERIKLLEQDKRN